MRRWRRMLLGIGLGVLLMAGASAWLLRRSATHGDVPEPVPGAAGLHRIHNGFVDLYAIKAGDGAVLIDAGLDPTGRTVAALLERAGAPTAPLTVLITHGHFDHVAGLPALARARSWAGRADVPLMRGEGGRGRWVTRILWAVIGIGPTEPTDAIDPSTGPRSIPLPGTDETVRAIPMPGHTAGSMAYLFRGVLFVGDALDFKRGHLDIPAETFADDPAAGRRSLAQLASALGDTDLRVVCTGHGGCTPPGAARSLLAEVLAKL